MLGRRLPTHIVLGENGEKKVTIRFGLRRRNSERSENSTCSSDDRYPHPVRSTSFEKAFEICFQLKLLNDMSFEVNLIVMWSLRPQVECMIHFHWERGKAGSMPTQSLQEQFPIPYFITSISSSLFDCRRRPSARPPTEPHFRIIQLMLKAPLLFVLLKLIPYIQALHAHNTKQLPVVTFPRRCRNNAAVRTDKKLRCACPHAIPIDGA